MTAKVKTELRERVHWDARIDSDNDSVWLCQLEHEQVDQLNYPVFGFFRLDVGKRCVAFGYVSGACPEDYQDCPDGLSFTWLPTDYSLFGRLWTFQSRAALVAYLTEKHPDAAQYAARYQRKQT